MAKGGLQSLVLCAVVVCLALCGVGAEERESMASIVQMKLRGLHHIMDHDWLTELVDLRNSDGGLDRALVEARFLAAWARGHPEEVLYGGSGAALRDSLTPDSSARALGDLLRKALAASEGTWIDIERSDAHLLSVLLKIDCLESATVDTKGDDQAPTVLHVEGMHCGKCQGRVEGALSSVRGVEGVVVSLQEGKAIVQGTAPAETLAGVLSDAGYPAQVLEYGRHVARDHVSRHKLRVRAGARELALHLEAAIGTLRAPVWPFARMAVVWTAVKATVWLAVDTILCVLTWTVPISNLLIDTLDYIAKKQSGPFRGMLVALVVLVMTYWSISVFIECVFFSAGVVSRSVRMAARFLMRKKSKKS